MLTGFRSFVLRGNVIDLAVAVVIGAAFTAIVNSLVQGVIDPVVALVFNADSLATAGITLREATADSDAIVLSWGLVISAIIQFFVVALVVYFALITPMNALRRLKKVEQPETPAAPSEAELLAEIRDLLKAQQKP